MGHLRKQIPYFGQKKAQEKLLENLAQEFQHVQREFHLHPGEAAGARRGVRQPAGGMLVGRQRRRAADVRGSLAAPASNPYPSCNTQAHTRSRSHKRPQETSPTWSGTARSCLPLTSAASPSWTRP